jgi:hypothetical protein
MAITDNYERMEGLDCGEEIKVCGVADRVYNKAAEPVLDHAVVLKGAEDNLKNRDKWNQRDEGVKVGAYTLYPLTLKP